MAGFLLISHEEQIRPRQMQFPLRTVNNGRGALGSQEPPKAIQMTTDVE
jgi:hypothetical protein